MFRNLAVKYGPRLGLVSVSVLPMLAHAADPADALAAVGSLTTGQAAYGPVMFGLAIAAVGIMVGLKWIKRARGAA
jgi:hypothetical protein